jgi:hypothetical protein
METMKKQTAENFIKEVRRKTRRVFSSACWYFFSKLLEDQK